MSDTEAILERISQACPPAQPEGWLAALPALAEIRRGHPRPQELLACLTEEFGEARLCEARVAIRGGAAEGLSLHPDLCGPEKTLVALRRQPNEPPYDLVGESGCLVGGEPPALAVLNDMRTRSCLQQHDSLLLAGSVADMAALRMLGLPAATLAGLSLLGGKALERFCQAFGEASLADDGLADDGLNHRGAALDEDLDPSGGLDGRLELRVCHEGDDASPQEGQQWGEAWPDAQDDAEDDADADDPPWEAPPRLTLVAWRPATGELDAPEAMAAVQGHFALLERHLHVELPEVDSWRPTAEEQEAVAFGLRFGAPGDVARLMQASIDRAPHSPAPCEPARQKTLAEAVAAWRSADLAGDRHHCDKAWAQVVACLDAQLTEPLCDLAAAQGDPLAQSELMVLAEFSRMLHLEALAQSAEHQRRLRGGASLESRGELLLRMELMVKLLGSMQSLIKRRQTGKSVFVKWSNLWITAKP